MYHFFFGPTYIPVPPPSMTTKIKNKNKTFDLINGGEANIQKLPGLTEIDFELLLPNQWYPFSMYEHNNTAFLVKELTGYQMKDIIYAQTYLNELQLYKTTKQPFRFIIVRLRSDFKMLSTTNMMVTLEDYTIKEAASEAFDFKVDISLKQYVPFRAKELELVEDENGNKSLKEKPYVEADDRMMENAILVTKRMTAFEAIKRAKGNSIGWENIANLNGFSIDDLLPKGTVIDLFKNRGG